MYFSLGFRLVLLEVLCFSLFCLRLSRIFYILLTIGLKRTCLLEWGKDLKIYLDGFPQVEEAQPNYSISLITDYIKL